MPPSHALLLSCIRVCAVADVPFEVRFSIGNVVSVSGAVLFIFCIGKFLLSNGESDVVSTFGFVYAIPALVGGLALKYAELPPVNLDTSPAAEALREQKATTIQAKILSDATRFTYGDAHMEDPLKALKLAPRGMGPPELTNLAESVTASGEYCLTMRFFAPNTPYRVWKDRAPRYARFFGPNVRATLKKCAGALSSSSSSVSPPPPTRHTTPLPCPNRPCDSEATLLGPDFRFIESLHALARHSTR